MHPDEYSGRNALTQKAAAEADEALTDRVTRQFSPADGAVAGSGQLVCVYCAPCARWIDCYDGIPPEVVLVRHGTLFH